MKRTHPSTLVAFTVGGLAFLVIAALAVLFLQPVVHEQLGDFGRIEVLHAHAGMIDPRARRPEPTSSGAARSACRWCALWRARGRTTGPALSEPPGRAAGTTRPSGRTTGRGRASSACWTTSVAGKHQKVDAVAHAPRGRCGLI